MKTRIEDSATIKIAGHKCGTEALKKCISKRPRIHIEWKGHTWERVERADGKALMGWTIKPTIKPWKEVWHALFPWESKKKVSLRVAKELSNQAQVEYREYRHGVLALIIVGSMGYIREQGLL